MPPESEEDPAAESLEGFQPVAGQVRSPDTGLDLDESETAEGIELPGADLFEEVLAVRIVPVQKDESIC